MVNIIENYPNTNIVEKKHNTKPASPSKGGLLKKLCIILSMCFFFLMSTSLYSQSKLVKSIGIGGGISLPQGGWDVGNTFLLQTDFGEVTDYLFLSPFLNYAQASKTETINEISKDLSIQYYGGGAKLVGYINSKPRGFYFGGSLSYYYITSEIFDPDHVSEHSEIEKEKTTKLGFGGLAGYLFTLKRVSLFIEADYMFMHDSYNNLLVFVGLNYIL